VTSTIYNAQKRTDWKGHCVYDSTWEASEAYFLEKSESVQSFVKNDHFGFVIFYNYKGVIRKYFPDFIIRLVNSEYLVLEVKGQDDQQNRTKREFLHEWVNAVNEHGGFLALALGRFVFAIGFGAEDNGVFHFVKSVDMPFFKTV
jgi:hypothetical protein